jgi:hypothetical protein
MPADKFRSKVRNVKEPSIKANCAKKSVAGRTSGSVLPLSKSGRQGKRKASREEPVLDGGESKAPQTPKKRYKVAPVTPTATVGGVVVHEEGAPKNQTHRPRRAEPHATNAPLQTPGGSHVLKKYSSDLLNMSPSQAHVADFTTTENLLAKACEHLCSVDPRLEAVIDKHHCKLFSPEGLQEVVDPFVALSSSIISQQVRSSRHIGRLAILYLLCRVQLTMVCRSLEQQQLQSRTNLLDFSLHQLCQTRNIFRLRLKSPPQTSHF